MRLLPDADISLIRFEILDFFGFDIDFPFQQFRVLGPACEGHLDKAAVQYHGCQLIIHLLKRMSGEIHTDSVFPGFRQKPGEQAFDKEMEFVAVEIQRPTSRGLRVRRYIYYGNQETVFSLLLTFFLFIFPRTR